MSKVLEGSELVAEVIDLFDGQVEDYKCPFCGHTGDRKIVAWDGTEMCEGCYNSTNIPLD